MGLLLRRTFDAVVKKIGNSSEMNRVFYMACLWRHNGGVIYSGPEFFNEVSMQAAANIHYPTTEAPAAPFIGPTMKESI